ncbi:ribonuclease H-like domain-containing protein [Mycena pura]|uniref:Ribonuclease H-like domain-containing protein n=1 Tax=Mycena pura TaxID=153505 RepID=A0AAD6UMI7_9AGAR|nr:ribonuclease H-like domain-containing protein [Mycena pura]
MTSLSAHFTRGRKANQHQYRTYCNGCIAKYKLDNPIDTSDMDNAEAFQARTQHTQDAITSMGEGTLGYAEGWVVHILGAVGAHQSKPSCPNATAQARTLAQAADRRKTAAAHSDVGGTSGTAMSSRKRRSSDAGDASKNVKKPALRQTELVPVKGIDLPFADSHRAAIQAQCERVVVSSNLAEGFFQEPEVKTLFQMFRSRAPDVLPSRTLIGGRLLNEAAASVCKKVTKELEGQNIGIQSDAWSRFRRGITGVCGIRPGKVTTLKLINTTAANKDGESMAAFFVKVISDIETTYSCYVIYFVTDADGGSKKGRVILLTLRPDLFLPSCFAHQSQLCVVDYFKVFPFALDIAEEVIQIVNWINNHDKVRDIFDRAQESVSADENQGRVIVLSYFTANLTRWTTHATSFLRVLRLKRALTQAAIINEVTIVKAQVGAAKSTEKVRLEEEARSMIARIVDRENRFWPGVETVIADLEPICFGMNINQQDDVRPDQVLLAFVGMFLHFADHPEDEVKNGMVKRLEKRWKDADQTMFLLALLLNPFEGLSAFGPDAGFNPFILVDLLLTVYRRTQDRPGNPDGITTRSRKEVAIEDAFFRYLASTGMYKNFRDKMESWIERCGKCPLQVWQHALSSGDLGEQELRTLAILLLEIVCNTAGAERLFSNLKIRLSDRRARTGLEKLEKKAKVGESIRREHIQKGLITAGTRKRQNHADASSLLAVPRHSDLLEDQDAEDEAERGRALLRAEKTWRIGMAKWIGEQRAEAAAAEAAMDSEDETVEREPEQELANTGPSTS